MFGKRRQESKKLEARITYLENRNKYLIDRQDSILKRITIMENPAKYAIGLKIIDRYIITEREYQTGRYIANLQTLNYSYVVGWDYIVFDIKDNKHTTLCEDQITNLIEDGKTIQKKA